MAPGDELWSLVRSILKRELTEPKTQAQIADLLAVSKSQAKGLAGTISRGGGSGETD